MHDRVTVRYMEVMADVSERSVVVAFCGGGATSLCDDLSRNKISKREAGSVIVMDRRET